MKSTSLIGLGLGGAGTIAGTGVAINHFYGGETIKNYLTNSSDYKNRVFLGSIKNGLDEVLNAYDASQRLKPQDESKQNIKKDNLVKWCNDAINGKYYGNEDENFKAVVSWCYINTNSFEKELDGSGKTKISETNSNHQEWQTAWSSYSRETSDSNLRITGHAQSVVLNGDQATQGQTALMTWCKEKVSAKMYLDKAENDFARFKKWCTK